MGLNTSQEIRSQRYLQGVIGQMMAWAKATLLPVLSYQFAGVMTVLKKADIANQDAIKDMTAAVTDTPRMTKSNIPTVSRSAPKKPDITPLGKAVFRKPQKQKSPVIFRDGPASMANPTKRSKPTVQQDRRIAPRPVVNANTIQAQTGQALTAPNGQVVFRVGDETADFRRRKRKELEKYAPESTPMAPTPHPTLRPNYQR